MRLALASFRDRGDFVELHRQIDALNTLLSVDDNEQQRTREAQEIDFRFTLCPIFVDSENRHLVVCLSCHRQNAIHWNSLLWAEGRKATEKQKTH